MGNPLAISSMQGADVEIRDPSIGGDSSSLQICAAALSREPPRARKTPDWAPAARWSPRVSRGRRHQQKRAENGRCKRKRRRRRILKRWDGYSNSVVEGMVVKARFAKGPTWDWSKAWVAGGITNWNSLDIAMWTGVVACCCHPRVLSAFSSESVSAGLGRFPWANSTQFGGVQPCSWSACSPPAAAGMLRIAGGGCWRCGRICAAYWGRWVWSIGSESAHDDKKPGFVLFGGATISSAVTSKAISKLCCFP